MAADSPAAAATVSSRPVHCRCIRHSNDDTASTASRTGGVQARAANVQPAPSSKCTVAQPCSASHRRCAYVTCNRGGSDGEAQG